MRTLLALMRNLMGCLVFLLACGGCSGLKQSFEDCQQATETIKTEMGVDAQCGVRVMNGHTFVSIKLSTTPPGDAATVKSDVTGIVTRTFRRPVDRVDIAL